MIQHAVYWDQLFTLPLGTVAYSPAAYYMVVPHGGNGNAVVCYGNWNGYPTCNTYLPQHVAGQALTHAATVHVPQP